MANELAVVEENWIELAGKLKDIPMPFERTVFLAECNLAGTDEIDDMLVKTRDVEEGTMLTLRREKCDAQNMRAVAALTPRGDVVGYLPRRYSSIMARLMDAGKELTAKVNYKMLMNHWLDIEVTIDMKEA